MGFDLYNSILLMCLERLHEPSSKCSNFLHQEEYLGVEPVKLHHLYRSLDYLAGHQELIQKCIYQKGRDLFNQSLDVVFYDVTTFYFDSETETPAALRQKGFSKDGKIGNTQILFGMLIDKDKNPIAYKIYKGRKIICTFSQKRAIKDDKDREDKLETAAQLLKYQNLLKKKVQHYFLQESQTGTI